MSDLFAWAATQPDPPPAAAAAPPDDWRRCWHLAAAQGSIRNARALRLRREAMAQFSRRVAAAELAGLAAQASAWLDRAAWHRRQLADGGALS